MAAPYIIGLDIGTSSLKALALDASGSVRMSLKLAYPTYSPRRGYAELDPAEVWETFVAALHKMVREPNEPPAMISLSSCMHSVLAVDGSGGPLTGLLLWSDRRSAPQAEELRASPQAGQLYRVTGTPLHAMSPLTKLMWFARHDPGLITSAAKFVSIKEFIWFRLFGV